MTLELAWIRYGVHIWVATNRGVLLLATLRYLDFHLKENLIGQTSQKPVSFSVKGMGRTFLNLKTLNLHSQICIAFAC